MQYRKDKPSGNRLSALGLGCMRFSVNKAETERMILAAIKGGVNYFDTAYIYPNSENILGEILAKHNKRKDVYIATKMPVVMCKSGEDFDRFFNEQLQRLQTDYIDYYMLHNITNFAKWEMLKSQGVEQWIADKKKTGKIRRMGFSYHGTCGDFIKILDSCEWEFCLIQYNYYDENFQTGKKGLKAAAAKGISVMIMEPLLGGKLAAGLPKQAVEMFAKTDPSLKPADWAFWWLWNQSEVTVVLSGMNSLQQMEENIRSADLFKPLDADKLAVYSDVTALFKKSYKIPCTGCNYCMPCPEGINIPACFSAYNAIYTQGFVTGITLYITSTAITSKTPVSPRNCNECGKCEKQCPQNLPVRKLFKKTSKRFEPLPLRMLFAVIRRFISG
ncbi:MAG: aldo/keto reductase [Treponema sp.]|nr:aldo/keto reductase [Treponema sp.]